MGKAYIKNLEVQGSPYVYCDIVTMGGGSPPDRPQPGPGPGPGGEHPAFPIWGPPGSRPGAGFPDNPAYPTIPGGPGGESPGPGQQVTMIPVPPQEPPVPPPTGMPAGSTQVLVWYGPGTLPAMGWVGPYPSTGPIAPPAEPTVV